METKIIRSGLVVICSGIMAMITFAQEVPLDIPRRKADPSNSQIEGRVLAPSGQSANFNVKITLSELHRPLTTIYTNKHAEFRFPNLREGEYYVQVIADQKIYEPVTQKVRLNRSQNYQLTITLRRKEEIVSRKTGTQVISASELTQAVPVAARKEYDQAVKLLGRGDLSHAIERLQRALVIYADYLDARNDLGAQYLKLKRFHEAAEQFRIVLEQDAKYFNARFNRGLVLIEQKDYPSAIAQLKQAVSIDPAQPVAQLWLGVALLQTGDLPGAEHELSRALITGGSRCIVAHYYLAQAYLRRGDTVEASGALKAYLEGSPKGEYAEDARLLQKKLATGSPPAKR